MSDGALEGVRNCWNELAEDWRVQVGADGDSNRRLNSDPVLWEFAGDVRGLSVLDAGCGTGYLSKKLRDRGVLVIGVDLAERMVEIARADHPGIDFRVDSCTELATVGDGEFDNETKLRNSKTRPYSIAFKLRKSPSAEVLP